MMETHDNFYVTLPSNASMTDFPNNSLTNYVTRLAMPIELSEHWEVGLAEIIHPNEWEDEGLPVNLGLADDDDYALTFTLWVRADFQVLLVQYVSEGQTVLALNMDKPQTKSIGDEQWYGNVYAVKVPVLGPGASRTAENVVHRVQTLMGKIQKQLFQSDHGSVQVRWTDKQSPHEKTKVYFYRMRTSNQKSLQGGFLNFELKRNSILARVLGFGSDNIKEPLQVDASTRYVAPSFPDPVQLEKTAPRMLYALFVYCDVARAQLLGDSHTKILRAVPVQHDRPRSVTISQRFSNIYYCRVGKARFDTVEIDIRDDTGRPVPFNSGRVIVVLHFRKIKD
jgi:hypothetical protein